MSLSTPRSWKLSLLHARPPPGIIHLGIRVVAIHKALPLGSVELGHYPVDDIDRAAMAFPDLAFEIVHGGIAFLEETAWQLARFDNVYVNLETTATLATTRPLAFAHALASLIRGPKALRRIVWGTGCMVSHPRPHLENFVRSAPPTSLSTRDTSRRSRGADE